MQARLGPLFFLRFSPTIRLYIFFKREFQHEALEIVYPRNRHAGVREDDPDSSTLLHKRKARFEGLIGNSKNPI